MNDGRIRLLNATLPLAIIGVVTVFVAFVFSSTVMAVAGLLEILGFLGLNKYAELTEDTDKEDDNE